MRRLIPALVLVLASCASADTEEPKLGLDDPRVGEEQTQACFVGSISGFSTWDQGRGLILRRDARERYLVTFTGSCTQLNFVQHVALVDRFGTACLGRGDGLYVSDEVFPTEPSTTVPQNVCTVNRVYAFDGEPSEAEIVAE